MQQNGHKTKEWIINEIESYRCRRKVWLFQSQEILRCQVKNMMFFFSPQFPHFSRRFSIISQTPLNFVHCLRSLSRQYSQVLGPISDSRSVFSHIGLNCAPFGYALPVPFVPDMHCQSAFFINFHEELQGCVFSARDTRPVSRPVKRYWFSNSNNCAVTVACFL